MARSRAKHGNKYDYGNVAYENNYTKVTIICNDCKLPFDQRPADHFDGNGCPHCKHKRGSDKRTLTQDEFIQKSCAKHGDQYDYRQAIYTGKRDKVTIICNACKLVFAQGAGSHMRGYGCPKCGQEKSAKTQTHTKDQFVADCIAMHGDLYDYENSVYVNSYTKIDILCNTCGLIFTQVASDHKRGNGCPYCRNKTEGKIGASLRRYYRDVESQAPIVVNGICYRFDYQIKDFEPMVYVEYHGELHYFPVDIAGKGKEWSAWNLSRVKRNDRIKFDYCQANAIPLIVVQYREEYPVWYVEYEIDRLLESSKIVYK